MELNYRLIKKFIHLHFRLNNYKEYPALEVTVKEKTCENNNLLQIQLIFRKQ